MFNFSQPRMRYSEIIKWKADEDYQVDESEVMASDAPTYIIMWESNVRHLFVEERLWFLSWTCLITALAIIGNVLTLCVVVMR